MQVTKFERFVVTHRKLLESGIRKHPTRFKKADLAVYDKVVSHAKTVLTQHGLYESWEPATQLTDPLQFLDPNTVSVLMEQVSSEIPADVNAAMKSQIEALKRLRAFYLSLPADKKSAIDDAAVDSTKTRMSFGEELEDIEDEINGIYGKLNKGGKLGQLAKRGFGLFQRGMGKLFGAGEVGKVNLENLLYTEKLEVAQLALNSPMAQTIANSIRSYLEVSKVNLLPTNVVNNLANAYGVSPHDIGNIAHSVGANVQGTLGNLTAGTAAGAGSSSVASGAGTSVGAVAKPVGGTAGKAVAGGSVGSKLAGLGIGAKAGIAGVVAALVAAGAAGVKMRNRRKRIETLQGLARQFGARGAVVTPPIENPEVEAPQVAPTSRASAPTQVGYADIPPTNQQLQSPGVKSYASNNPQQVARFMKTMGLVVEDTKLVDLKLAQFARTHRRG